MRRLKRLDGRITAAWQSADQIGFAWSASQANGYTEPHVRVAIFNTKDLKAAPAQPHLWSDQYALAYPAVMPLEDGQIARRSEWAATAS